MEALVRLGDLGDGAVVLDLDVRDLLAALGEPLGLDGRDFEGPDLHIAPESPSDL